MNWICDECEYENVYSDEEKNTVCVCCGAPAPAEKLKKAQQELDEYHRELEKKAHQEELQRKREIRLQKLERASSAVKRLINSISVVEAACIIAAVAWIEISMYSEHMDLTAWAGKMSANIRSVSLTDYPGFIKENLQKYYVDPAKDVKNVLLGHEDAPNDDADEAETAENDGQGPTVGNADVQKLSCGIQVENLCTNVLMSAMNSVQSLQNVRKNRAMMQQNISEFNSEWRNNMPIFRERALKNIQGLISSIKRKLGDTDG